jgi:hypothetical protein
MSVLLSENTQQQIEDELVKEGLISTDKLELYRAKAKQANEPLFALLIKEGAVKDEELSRASAKVNQLPYVNLSDASPRMFWSFCPKTWLIITWPCRWAAWVTAW